MLLCKTQDICGLMREFSFGEFCVCFSSVERMKLQKHKKEKKTNEPIDYMAD